MMGGECFSTFKLNEDGFSVFEDSVSLNNNGGFSSVRYRFQKTELKQFTSIVAKLRRDGKEYQLSIKSNYSDYYSYIMPFSTSGE